MLLDVMHGIKIICAMLVIVLNIYTFILFGIDKHLSKIEGAKRIPEKKLLTLAVFFCAFGASFGMAMFHHKTRKTKFTVLVPLCIILNIFEINILVCLYGILTMFFM